MSRLVLWVGGVLFVPFGLWVLFEPAWLSAITERPLPTPTAATESRALDGGLTAGLGLFLIAAAVDPTKTRAGLLLMLLAVGGAFVGRCVGVVLDGGTPGTYKVAALELILAALAGIALARHPNPLGGRSP
jgi:hypothetical protein